MDASITARVLGLIHVRVLLGGREQIAVHQYANRPAFIMETAHCLILVHVNAVGLGRTAVLHCVRKSVKMEVIVLHLTLANA